MLGYEQGHRPWAPLPPPSGGGFLRHLGGWRRPGGDETYPVETMVKVAFLKSFPLKKKMIKEIRFVTEQKATGEGPATRGGSRGAPTLGIDEEGLSSAGCLYTGSHTRRCICKRGKGALASGNLVSLLWPPVRGLWLSQHRAFGEPGASPQMTVSALSKNRGALGGIRPWRWGPLSPTSKGMAYPRWQLLSGHKERREARKWRGWENREGGKLGGTGLLWLVERPALSWAHP